MRDTVVVNTGPLIALIAATGDLEVMRPCFARVVVPLEVEREVLSNAGRCFGADKFLGAAWLARAGAEARIAPFLRRSLHQGEASVVQTAIDQAIPLVCIDEAVGRRIARLHGLAVTGSIGVLIRARGLGAQLNLARCLERMTERGVWVSDRLVAELRRLGHI